MALVDLKRRKFVFGLKVFRIEMAQNKFQLHYNCDNCQRWWIRKWFPMPEMTRERANARVHCSLFFRFIQHCHFTEWLNYMVKTFVTIKNHFFFAPSFFRFLVCFAGYCVLTTIFCRILLFFSFFPSSSFCFALSFLLDTKSSWYLGSFGYGAYRRCDVFGSTFSDYLVVKWKLFGVPRGIFLNKRFFFFFIFNLIRKSCEKHILRLN